MQRCALQISLPSSAEFILKNERRSVDPHFVLKGSSIPIDIYALAPTFSLDPKFLNFRNRPRRTSRPKFETIIAKWNETIRGKEFECERDRLYAFELSCGAAMRKDCMLDLWQDRVEYQIGQSFNSSSLKVGVS